MSKTDKKFKLDSTDIDLSKDDLKLEKIKAIEGNKTLVRVDVINGYVMTTNPDKWKNYIPFDNSDLFK